MWKRAAVLVALITLSCLVSAVNIASCTNLSSANTIYNITSNLSTSDTCLSVEANNITIECNAYTISYGIYGVNNTAYTNDTTIKNCNFVGNASVSYSGYARGIYLTYSTRGTINNSNITNLNKKAYGIDLAYCDNYTISSNTITGNSSDGLAFGLELVGLSAGNYPTPHIRDPCAGNSIINNVITMEAPSRVGILLSRTDNSTFNNNTITAKGTGDVADSFYFIESQNNNISNSTLTTYNAYIIYSEDSDSSSNLFYNNLFNSSRIINTDTYANYFNISNQTGTRIYSSGNQIGGNYYTTNNSNGFSDTCTDSDLNGFCDSAYNLTANTTCVLGSTCGYNVDYLPLSDEYGVTINSCTISPAPASGTQNLTANGTGSWTSGLSPLFSYLWFKNGVSLSLSGTELGEGNFSNGDNITLQCTLNDSTYTASLNSSVLMIGDSTVPTITNIITLDDTVTIGDIITVCADPTDAGSVASGLAWLYSWADSGATLNQNITLTASNASTWCGTKISTYVGLVGFRGVYITDGSNNTASNETVNINISVSAAPVTPGNSGGGTTIIQVDENFTSSPARVYEIFVYPLAGENWTYVLDLSRAAKTCSISVPFKCRVEGSTLYLTYPFNSSLGAYGDIKGEVQAKDSNGNILRTPIQVTYINAATYLPVDTEIKLDIEPLFTTDEEGNVIGLKLWWIILIMVYVSTKYN